VLYNQNSEWQYAYQIRDCCKSLKKDWLNLMAASLNDSLPILAPTSAVMARFRRIGY